MRTYSYDMLEERIVELEIEVEAMTVALEAYEQFTDDIMVALESDNDTAKVCELVGVLLGSFDPGYTTY